MVFLDYTTVSIGSRDNNTPQTIFTAPYKCLVSLEITANEFNGRFREMFIPVSGDSTRANWFIKDVASGGDRDTIYGTTKVLATGQTIVRAGDFSPFAGVLHIFRLPEAP